MPGLGGGQGGADRLLVAHLADEDDVGVLAQHPAQRTPEGACVGPDLALVDDRALVGMQELDWILDRHDVARRCRVDVVHHCGQRGRLAGAGGAGDEHDAARLLGHLPDRVGQTELADRREAIRDAPADERDRASLAEGVDAEPGQSGDGEREVDLSLGRQLLEPGGLGQDLRQRLLGVGPLEELGARKGLQLTRDPGHGGRADFDVKVRALVVGEILQRCAQVEGHVSPPARGREPHRAGRRQAALATLESVPAAAL